MTIKPKKKIVKKSTKELKTKLRRRNPLNPSVSELEEFLDKKIVLRVSYGNHKSGGSVYGILEKLPHQDNMYGVSSIENTPRNKEGAFFFFNIKDVNFAGRLFGGPLEVSVGELKEIK